MGNIDRNRKNRFLAGAVGGLAAVLLTAGPLLGQAQSGNVYGKVLDDQGGALPGATVTLSGVGATVSSVSNGQGEYRFLNLSPGSYKLTFALSGFAGVTRDNVVVAVAKNTELTTNMRLSNVATEVTVTGETPVLDTRKTSVGASIPQAELASIPTARDPWVILQSVPGVLMDRVNVGGNESGQQSTYVAKGSSGSAGVWNVDGVNVTDVGAVGSSPTYWDFDSFEEMQVSTGGSDVTLMTAGASLNMVTKRGTNDVHGSGRTFITDQRWQSNTDNEEATAQGFQRGNRIDAIQDYGLEVGGPVVRDRFWAWASYGRNQVDLRTPATAAFPKGFSDKTTLEDINAKLNLQIANNNNATAFFLRGDKIKNGRNASPTRPQETTFDQTGPTSVYKIEDTQIFSSNLFATALGSYVDGGFGLVAQGGTGPYAYRTPDNVNHGTYYTYESGRNQTQFTGSASAFARTGELGHEFKIGFSYRKAPVTSNLAWPHGLRMFERNPAATGASRSFVNLYRNLSDQVDTNLYGAYLSDTITISNLTINAGARFDSQSGRNRASVSVANPSFPDILPESRQGDTEKPFTWSDVSPRLGVTYALGKDNRKTLIRASYGHFVDNLSSAYIAYNNNAQYGYLQYRWTDGNGDHIAQRSEINFQNLIYAYNVNSTCPTCPSPNRIDGNLKSPTTDEVVLGVEREVLPGLGVSVNGTYRKFKNFIWSPGYGFNADGSFHVYNRSDFELSGTEDGADPLGRAYSVPIYGLRSTSPERFGSYTTNRPDYDQTYKGLELQVNKRYANRWSMRASFTFSDWTQNVGADAVYDPTNQLAQGIYGGPAFSGAVGGSNEDGGQVAFSSGVGSGSKADVYVNSRWNVSLNALYSLPLGFNLAGSFFAREGYPQVFFSSNPDPGDGLGVRNALVQNFGDLRYPTVTNLDLRLEKAINLAPLSVTLSLDLFNALNSNTVLQRKSDVTASANAGGDIVEIQSPRVVRFGGRVSF